MPYVDASVRRPQFVAAARAALVRHGVAGTSVRVVAAEAGVPLATMQYVFSSKAELLRAVIDDVVEDIVGVLDRPATTGTGLAHEIRQGLEQYWARSVRGGRELQLLQYELTIYALRTPGHEHLARMQYERYAAVVATRCRQAAGLAGEVPSVSFEHLAQMVVAGLDGLILQHACDPHEERARARLQSLIDMAIGLARGTNAS